MIAPDTAPAIAPAIPAPSAASPDAVPHIFEREYYQRLHDIEEQHGWAQGLRAAMDALLRRPVQGMGPLRVLDIGCGTGYLLNYLERYSLAGEPVGIDVSSYALEFCRERGATALAEASALTVPFAAGSFDLIICIDTIQHLTPAGADRQALTEFARLLRPGGLLYLRTNSAKGHVPLTGVDPDQYRRYRLEVVEEMLRSTGFAVERGTYVNAVPGGWAALREHWRAWRAAQTQNSPARSKRTQQAAAIGPGLAIRPHPAHLAWLNRTLYGILALEAWLLGALSLSLPFGHSIACVARRTAEPLPALSTYA
jgi:SAM-dependent methyltransferase